MLNKKQGALNVVAVPTPEFVKEQRALLHEDIAILTGGLPVSDELFLPLNTVQLGQLGQAERVIVDGQTTTIIGGAGTARRSRARIEQIRAELASGEGLNEFELDKLRERMARLGGRVAVIRVGADTEPELIERRHRIEDAVRATRAALTEGVVAGGGAALLHARVAIDAGDRDGRRGDRRRDRAPRAGGAAAPDRDQRRRWSRPPPSRWSRRSASARAWTRRPAPTATCFDAGVIDPAMVTRSALANAASIAKNVLTTECVVTEPGFGDLTTLAREVNDYSHTVVHRPPRQAALRRRRARDAAGRRRRGRRRDQGHARPARPQRPARRRGRPA